MSASRRRSRHRTSLGRLRLVGVLAAAVLIAVGFLWWRLAEQEESIPAIVAQPEIPQASEAEPALILEEEDSDIPEPENVPSGRVALVIDDLGRSLAEIERLEALGIEISYSVLPFEVLTEEVVAVLREHHREFLCHLPMEPSTNANPGPGALLSSMSPDVMERATSKALDAVAGAVGVNNHMGSGLSTNVEAMALVGGVLAERDLFFLDSRTTAESVAYEVIRDLGVPSAQRQVFLDPDLGEQAIRDQFHRLVEMARKEGSAIGIGHPHPVTFSVLEQEIPAALAAGVEFIPVSYLLDRFSPPS